MNLEFFFVILGTVSPTLAPPKIYYISLELENYGQKPVTLKWKQDKEDKELNVPQLATIRYDVIITSSVQPAPINFIAYEGGTSNMVRLNNTDTLTLSATEEKTPVVVTIGGGGMLN